MIAPAEQRTQPNRLTLWRNLALAAWALAILAVSTRVALNKSPTRQDLFPVYREAGQSWLAGRDLYHNTQFDYRYSPLFAAAMAPISVLPLKLGSVLWRLASVSIFLGALHRASRLAIPDERISERIWLFFLLLLPLALGNLNNGQANLLVIGLLVASIAAVREKSWMVAAISVTAAAAIKIYPLAFCLPLLLIKPRHLFWRFGLCVLAALVLPFVLQRPDYVARQYSDWFQYLETEDRSLRPLTERYNDLRLLFQVWSLPISGRVFLIIQVAVAALIAVGAWLGRVFGGSERHLLAWTLSLSSCWMVLFGPATESSTYVLIAPATAWIVVGLFCRHPRVWEIAWVAVVYCLQVLPGIAAWFGGMKRLGIYTSPLALSALLLGVYLLRPAVFRQMKATAPNSPLGD